MAEKLDPEAKRLRNVSPGELADAIRRELHRAEGEAYRIVLTPPGTSQRTDKPLLLKVLGITAAEYTARFCHPVHFGEGERTLRPLGAAQFAPDRLGLQQLDARLERADGIGQFAGRDVAQPLGFG